MPPRPTLLCAIDASTGAEEALRYAAGLAERTRGALHLLHVRPPAPIWLATGPAPAEPPAFEEYVQPFVDETLGAHADTLDVRPVAIRETPGDTVSDGILAYVDEIGADLVVMGTHGWSGVNRILLGSVAAAMVRRSRGPVLLVPERLESQAPSAASPVLVGADLATALEPVFEAARSMAAAHHAPLAVAHAYDDSAVLHAGALLAFAPSAAITSRREVHEALDRSLQGLDASVTRHVVPGPPARVLVDLAREIGAGLLVVGAHARVGWDRLRNGSVAEAVAQRSPCPVLIVASPTSPVAP